MERKIEKQGRVVRRYKRNIPRDDFDKWRELIRGKARGCGLYALYDRKKRLVYVGLATRSIKGRIQEHIKKKHFSYFSVFLVTGAKNSSVRARRIRDLRIRDLEALLLKIIKPTPIYNKYETNFVAAQKLRPSTVD